MLNDQLALEGAEGIDIVFHVAANADGSASAADLRSGSSSNVIGSINDLEANRYNNVKCFMFPSILAPIGNLEPGICEKKYRRLANTSIYEFI